MTRSRILPACVPVLLVLPFMACASSGALSGGGAAAGPCDGRPDRDQALCRELCRTRPVDDRCLLLLRFGEPGWLALQDIRKNRRLPTEAAKAQGMGDREARRFLAWLQGTADVPVGEMPARKMPADRVEALGRHIALMVGAKAAEDRKDPAAALDAYGKALEIARSDLEAFPLVAATTLVRLANVLAADRPGEAAERLGEAIAAYRTVPGVDPILLGVHLHNRAGYLRAAGRIEEAAEAYGEAVAADVATLGEEHPRTASERRQRARMLERLGRHGEAADELESALRSYEAVQGPLHRETLEVRMELGVSLRAAHRALNAAAMLERAADGRERTMGPGHPATLVAMNTWAGALKDAGALDLAIQVYRKALARADDLPRGTSRDDFLATLWDNLGVSLSLADRHEEARVAQEKSLEIAERMGDPVHVETCRGNLGTTLSGLGRLDEARPHLEAALEGATRRHGAASLAAGIAADNLGILELKAGRAEEAAALMRRALEAFLASDGADSPHVAIVWTNLGHALWRLGQKRESLEAFGRSVAAGERVEVSRQMVLAARANRAVLRMMLDGPDAGLPDLRDALARAEDRLGPDDPLTRSIRDAIADPGAVKSLLTAP